jgi:hypothetical protein
MEVINNDLVKGASGRVGDQLVYRQRGDKTIIAKRPRPKSTPDTERQIEVQETFFNAAIYAKAVIADPAKKAMYQAKTTGYQTAYNLAVSDFCKAPEIKVCDSDDYSGELGDKIRIRAIDDFKVESVRLEIKDGTNDTVEEGAATLHDNGVDWIYTATAANAFLPGTKLIVSATDIPGNLTKREFTI